MVAVVCHALLACSSLLLSGECVHFIFQGPYFTLRVMSFFITSPTGIICGPEITLERRELIASVSDHDDKVVAAHAQDRALQEAYTPQTCYEVR